MSSPDYMYVSSSIAKEVASFGGEVDNMVPTHVEEALRRKFLIR